MRTTIRVVAPLGAIAGGLLLAASCSRTAPHTGPGAWPLEGAHAATTCDSCHKNSFTARPTKCSSCHEDDRPQSHLDDPDRADAECVSCHTTFAWVFGDDDTGLQGDACTGICHGTAGVNAAPPVAVDDNDVVGHPIDPVGDHQAHVQGGNDYTAASCGSCHVEFLSPDDLGHFDSPGQEDPAEIIFGDYSSEAALPATWDPATGVCSNTWCHGGSPGMADAEGVATAPTWGGNVSCGDCHGLPSLTSHEPDQTVCSNCHPPTTSGLHVNGRVDFDL